MALTPLPSPLTTDNYNDITDDAELWRQENLGNYQKLNDVIAYLNERRAAHDLISAQINMVGFSVYELNNLLSGAAEFIFEINNLSPAVALPQDWFVQLGTGATPSWLQTGYEWRTDGGSFKAQAPVSDTPGSLGGGITDPDIVFRLLGGYSQKGVTLSDASFFRFHVFAPGVATRSRVEWICGVTDHTSDEPVVVRGGGTVDTGGAAVTSIRFFAIDTWGGNAMLWRRRTEV